jgi:hypothetical protein
MNPRGNPALAQYRFTPLQAMPGNMPAIHLEPAPPGPIPTSPAIRKPLGKL